MTTYSAIIPAYNSARTVGHAVESVLAQTFTAEVIVVVNEGSSDGTADVVSAIPGVTLIRQENRGPGAARNFGAARSCGDWLAFLDADDTWDPRKMERQLSGPTEPNVGVIHCRGPEARNPAPRRVRFDDLWESNCISLSSAVVRRSAFEEVGGFDEDRSLISVEDYNLWLRIAASGWEIATWPETLISYAPGPESLSSQGVRFARANLLNARLVGEQLRLEPAAIRRRIHQIQVAFGKGLFWSRDLVESRRLFAEALRGRPSPSLLCQFLATFIPRPILDLRRRARGY